jgi:hypothetical protein
MARAKKSCLTNWTFGSLTSDINTFPNKYWTYCPIIIEYCASLTQSNTPFDVVPTK